MFGTGPHFFQANAQGLQKVEPCLLHRSDSCKLRFVLRADTGGTAFSPAFLIKEIVL